MKCLIIHKRDCSVARLSGPITGNLPFIIRNVVHAEFNAKEPRVILDMKEFDDSGSLIMQLALIAAFKKEVDFMNGSLKICSLKSRIRNYLFENRMDEIFDMYEDLNSAEQSPWMRKKYERKQRNSGTPARHLQDQGTWNEQPQLHNQG